MDGTKEELVKVGISCIGGEEDCNKRIGEDVIYQAADLLGEEPIGAVVVALDFSFNFKKLCLASLAIQKGAKFMCTNGDAWDNIGGKKLPGAGLMVQAIREGISKRQNEPLCEPIIAGKPNPYAVEIICQDNGIQNREKMIMFGDRQDTDILMANNAGIDSCLLLTGCTESLEHAQKIQAENPNQNYRATFYQEKLAD